MYVFHPNFGLDGRQCGHDRYSGVNPNPTVVPAAESIARGTREVSHGRRALTVRQHGPEYPGEAMAPCVEVKKLGCSAVPNTKKSELKTDTRGLGDAAE